MKKHEAQSHLPKRISCLQNADAPAILLGPKSCMLPVHAEEYRQDLYEKLGQLRPLQLQLQLQPQKLDRPGWAK